MGLPFNDTSDNTVEFCVDGESYKTSYTVTGDLNASSTGRPLVTLHGGPGATHHYLLSLVDLWSKLDIAVVFYDQLGSGSSTHLPHKSPEFWTPELFMDELENLLNHLGISDNFDLLGHSWGGMLASQFAATRSPPGLKRLIISNSPASMPLWSKVAGDLIKGMPPAVQEKLTRHEAAGTTDSQEYQEAMGDFYAKHLCRLDPMPEALQKSFAALSEDPTVYNTMNGPSEFFVIGTLKEWSIIPELHKIKAETLVLNSRYDEAQDKCVRPYFQHIPKVKWYTFAESSHMPQWEEREKYMEVVGDFLTL